MIYQTTFAHAEFAHKKKTTRREKCLARMEAVALWGKLLAVLQPHYPTGQRGRPPLGLERMLRVYFLQQGYGLADEALEDALDDSQALPRFARIDLSAAGVPNATTLLHFRHLLETHTTWARASSPPSTPTSPRAACGCGKARWWMPRSLPRRPPLRMRTSNAIPKCTRPRRATHGILG